MQQTVSVSIEGSIGPIGRVGTDDDALKSEAQNVVYRRKEDKIWKNSKEMRFRGTCHSHAIVPSWTRELPTMYSVISNS